MMSSQEVPHGYKKTKVGFIPLEWETHRIDSILQRVRKKVDVQKDTMYQQIGIRSHAKGIFHKELVSGEQLGNKSVFWIEEDCFIVNIVFAWEQAVAKTTINEKGMIASHRFPMYKSKDNKVDIDYILYFFKSKRGKYFLGLASPGGAGRNKTLGQKEFSELKIPLPPLKEQQKIAKILTIWDDSISKQEELIKAKEQLKKGLMQKLLSGEVRFDGFSGEWEEVRLGDIGKVYQPQTISQSELTNQGYDVYGANGIIGKYHSYNHESEQIAITCRGNTCGTVNYTKEKSWITGNAMVINVDNSNNVHKKFLFYKLVNTNLLYLVTGSGQPQITGDIKIHKLQLPSLQEQQKIAQVLTTADKEIELLKNELESLKEQKKGLMQKLLTGEVRVKI